MLSSCRVDLQIVAESHEGRAHGNELRATLPNNTVTLTATPLGRRDPPPEYIIWFPVQKVQNPAKLIHGSQKSGGLWAGA